MIEKLSYDLNNNEDDARFNNRVIKNFSILKSMLDQYFDQKLLFEKRIAFRKIERPNDSRQLALQRELAEIRQDSRELYLLDAKAILDTVCKRNFNEFLNLETAYNNGEPYDFKSFIQYTLPAEQLVKRGNIDLSALSVKLKAGKQTPNRGDEMYIRFAIPNDLILDSSTPEQAVHEWFDSITEVYVEYDRKTELGFDVSLYGLSRDGFRSFPGRDYFIDNDFSKLSNLNYQQLHAEKEAAKLKDLYAKLGIMTIVPFGIMHIN